MKEIEAIKFKKVLFSWKIEKFERKYLTFESPKSSTNQDKTVTVLRTYLNDRKNGLQVLKL